MSSRSPERSEGARDLVSLHTGLLEGESREGEEGG